MTAKNFNGDKAVIERRQIFNAEEMLGKPCLQFIVTLAGLLHLYTIT